MKTVQEKLGSWTASRDKPAYRMSGIRDKVGDQYPVSIIAYMSRTEKSPVRWDVTRPRWHAVNTQDYFICAEVIVNIGIFAWSKGTLVCDRDLMEIQADDIFWSHSTSVSS